MTKTDEGARSARLTPREGSPGGDVEGDVSTTSGAVEDARGHYRKKPITVFAERLTCPATIYTPHGQVSARAGDWLVTDPNSRDRWPVAAHIFAATYERADPLGEAPRLESVAKTALANFPFPEQEPYSEADLTALVSAIGDRASRQQYSALELQAIVGIEVPRLINTIVHLQGLLAAMPSREKIARVIYDSYPGPSVGAKPEWVPGGNSFKQEEARRTAEAILAVNRSDSSGTSLGS